MRVHTVIFLFCFVCRSRDRLFLHTWAFLSACLWKGLDVFKGNQKGISLIVKWSLRATLTKTLHSRLHTPHYTASYGTSLLSYLLHLVERSNCHPLKTVDAKDRKGGSKN